MNAWPDRPARLALLAAMRVAATRLRLPLRQRTWRGGAGTWAGAGVGASIDFQDHRPYLPGDDPRSIDWNAYARSGHYTMKLYREEVSPRVDIAFDASASMSAEKAPRALELLYFAIESARSAGASTRVFCLGEAARPWPVESILGAEPPPDAGAFAPATLGLVPWRPGSLRVWLSDLLFPGPPEPILAGLVRSHGSAVVLAPFARGESEPDWLGNIELRDAESPARRRHHFTADALQRYRDAYARHFALWHDAARRHGVTLARVAVEPSFLEAVRGDALRRGALEVRG